MFCLTRVSASVGQYAIQLAALYSLDVITTRSSGNFDLVKDLGAGFAFDYKSSEIVEQIRAVGQELAHVFDAIGNNSPLETTPHRKQHRKQSELLAASVRSVPAKRILKKLPRELKLLTFLCGLPF